MTFSRSTLLRHVLPPLGVLLVGALVLLPDLGGPGLWDPPGKWGITVHRQLADDASGNRKKQAPFDSLRSEFRVFQGVRIGLVAEKSGATPAQRRRAEPAGLANTGLAQRPPLPRAAMLASARSLGLSDSSTRLPFALAALLCLMGTYVLLRGFFGLLPALVGAAILLSFPGFVIQGRQLTSEMWTLAAGTLAVGGLGLALAPAAGLARLAWLVPAALGLVLGFYSRGAVIGLLLPVGSVLMAVGVCHRSYGVALIPSESPRLPPGYWLRIGLLGGCAAVLCGLTWWALSTTAPLRYSAILGETPLRALWVANFTGINPPGHEYAVFDVQLKGLGYLAFPWIALLPVALASLLSVARAPASVVTPADTDDARRGRFGRVLLAAWALWALLLGTWWVLRCGNLSYVGLPAVAGLIGVYCVALVGRGGSAARLLGLAATFVICFFLWRDVAAVPEALITSHLDYRAEFPAVLREKWPLRLLELPFLAALTFLLIGAGRGAFVRATGGLASWLPGTGVGLGSLLGLRVEPEAAPERPADADPDSDAELRSPRERVWPGLVTLVLLAIAGAGIGYILQDPREAPWMGALRTLILAFLVMPLLLPVVPVFLRVAVDLLLSPFEAVRNLARGESSWWANLKRHTVADVSLLVEYWVFFWQREGWRLPLAMVPGCVVTISLAVRLVLKLVGGRLVELLLLPVLLYSELRRRRRPGAAWPSLRWVALVCLLLYSLGFTADLIHRGLPRLSQHYSYKAQVETYNRSNHAGSAPLGLFRVKAQSPAVYAKGPVVTEAQIRKAVSRKGSGTPLVKFLDEGWDDKHGQHQQRVYALLPVGQLGQLEFDAHRRDPKVPYYVLDRRSSFTLLVSNRLNEGERDVNPLRSVLLGQAPTLGCGANQQCLKLATGLAERKGKKEPSVELVAARLPRRVVIGSAFDLTLVFRVHKRVTGKFKIFVHIDGRSRVLADHDPVGGKFPTNFWTAGRWVLDHHRVPAAASHSLSTPPGRYNVLVGLFQGDTRMKVLSGPSDGKDRIKVGSFEFVHGLRGGCGR